jgi:putative Mn2+ efflux pump MntP
MTAEVLRLAAFVLPLGLDTFAVSAAIGVSGLSGQQRLRLSMLFVAFEGGMPLIGLGLGAPLSALVGQIADYIAVAVLIALGGWTLWPKSDDGEEERARSLTGARGLALIGLGVSISLDELAIGFSLGLVALPVAIAIPAIALQALFASQLGFALGSRVGERSREGAEKLAGIALIALGVLLLAQRLTSSG